MTSNKTVCHISFNHSPFDDRIYWKELVTLKKAGYNAIHIGVAHEYVDYTTPEGIRIITVKKKQFFKNVWINKGFQAVYKEKGTISEIFKTAKDLKASVYHYHDLQINAIARDLKELPHRPKLVYDAHEAYHLLLGQRESESAFYYFLKKITSKLIIFWEIRGASLVDLIITTDEYTNNYFKTKTPKVPVQIIHNYSYFHPAENLLPRGKKYDVIYAGQLSPKRGIAEIVISTYYCKHSLPEIKVLLIGEFETEKFRSEIFELINKLGLSKEIEVHSSVPFSDIDTYYKASRIGLCLLHDTPKFRTAIPIKLFEYMAFGLPVIVSKGGITAEIVRSSGSGLIVDYKETEAIAAAMQRLLEDTKLYQTLANNGQESVCETYNWQKESKKLTDAYYKLLTNNLSA